MAITFTWDSGYEGQPSSALSRSAIDNEIRKARLGVRGIMEREHNFGPYNDADDGSHIGGATTVLLKGNAATRDGLTNVQEGALYFLDDSGNKELYIYTSGAWVKATELDHGALTDLTEDTHTHYAKKAGDSLTGALDMAGNRVIISSPPALGTDDYLVFGKHRDIQHGSLGDNLAIPDDEYTFPLLDAGQNSASGTLVIGGQHTHIIESGLASYPTRFYFFPNFYATQEGVRICSAWTAGPTYWIINLKNQSGAVADYRINYKRVF